MGLRMQAAGSAGVVDFLCENSRSGSSGRIGMLQWNRSEMLNRSTMRRARSVYYRSTSESEQFV